MSHAHYAGAEVSRSTIDAVGIIILRQPLVGLHNGRRHILVGLSSVTIGQLLSEEQVVVGPDGIIVYLAARHACLSVGDGLQEVTLILAAGVGDDTADTTSVIDEVAVSEAVFDVLNAFLLVVNVA